VFFPYWVVSTYSQGVYQHPDCIFGQNAESGIELRFDNSLINDEIARIIAILRRIRRNEGVLVPFEKRERRGRGRRWRSSSLNSFKSWTTRSFWDGGGRGNAKKCHRFRQSHLDTE
jgi:hypothetical protein